MTSVSGMAASIRAATESDTFDLAGQNVSTITTTIQSAFGEPLPLHGTMIRITFITGAGKLGRQKYDEGAAKAVTSTLRELGYEDDRGASCVVECAGSFKLQHDTGKNLKTVVVFPQIASATAEVENGVGELSLEEKEGFLPEKSPENMIAMSSQAVFERMLSSKCPSWHQKKGCVAAIESLKGMLKGLDDKLLSGTPLSDPEQEFYDAVSLDSLEEKEAYVKQQMHSQVETSGNITKAEHQTLLKQVSERLEKIQSEIKESSDKPKKLEKLQAVLEKAQQRKELLEGITPKAPHKLRHEAEIHKLLKEIAPITKLENQANKGKLLSIQETQMVGKKSELEEQVAELEESSRGWFEDDDAFALRSKMCRDAFNVKYKQSQPAKKKTTTARTTAGGMGGYKISSNSTKFITPGRSGGGAWGAKKTTTAAKKSKPRGGAVFAAMMDSDSD